MAHLARRFKLTFEITVSKLLPAGVGWQAMAVTAGQWGVDASSTSFALLTGVGDAFGVGLGHLAYKACQRGIVSTLNKGRKDSEKLPEPSMPNEFQTAVHLGSAAMCSGTVWQPAVNFLTSLNLGFDTTFYGTGLVCAGVFFAGLRLGRVVYGRTGLLSSVAPNSYENLKGDAWLSLAVGGGSACFVGTDYSVVSNPFRDLFGITPTDSNLVGCLRAGASTAFGYFTLQSAQNLLLFSGKNYLDPNPYTENTQQKTQTSPPITPNTQQITQVTRPSKKKQTEETPEVEKEISGVIA